VGDLKRVRREHQEGYDHIARPLVVRLLKKADVKPYLDLSKRISKMDHHQREFRNSLAPPDVSASSLDRMAQDLQLSDHLQHILTVEVADMKVPRSRFEDEEEEEEEEEGNEPRRLFLERPPATSFP
jgi:hypothetical protein